MDVPLYDVYLTGKLADDVTPALAAQRLAALFKSSPEAMAGLITGKTQLLKRGVDKNTALKYRETLQKAGCEVAFKAQTIAIPNTDAPNKAPTPAQQPTPQASAPAATPASNNSGLQLAPAGGELLRADERAKVTTSVIETAHLSVAPVGPLPTSIAEPVAAPDTSHLSLTATGGNLVDESEREIIPGVAPDISDLSLAEVGAPIETLKNDATPLHPDTSGLTLTPAGSDLLTAAERNRPQPAAPKTDHLTLAP